MLEPRTWLKNEETFICRGLKSRYFSLSLSPPPFPLFLFLSMREISVQYRENWAINLIGFFETSKLIMRNDARFIALKKAWLLIPVRHSLQDELVPKADGPQSTTAAPVRSSRSFWRMEKIPEVPKLSSHLPQRSDFDPGPVNRGFREVLSNCNARRFLKVERFVFSSRYRSIRSQP